MTLITGFRIQVVDWPTLTNDRHASKSRMKSASLFAATSMSTFIFKPDWVALGVVNAVSAPPVGVMELASGLLASLAASTRRSWVYLPAGSIVWPSSVSTPLVSDRRSTRCGGLRTTSDHPASPSAAELD